MEVEPLEQVQSPKSQDESQRENVRFLERSNFAEAVPIKGPKC